MWLGKGLKGFLEEMSPNRDLKWGEEVIPGWGEEVIPGKGSVMNHNPAKCWRASWQAEGEDWQRGARSEDEQ